MVQVVGEEGVYECAICGAQFPGINMLGQHCQVLRKHCSLYNCIDIQLFTNNVNAFQWVNRKLQVHMEGQEPRVCQEEIVLHPDNVDQDEEKKFKSL